VSVGRAGQSGRWLGQLRRRLVASVGRCAIVSPRPARGRAEARRRGGRARGPAAGVRLLDPIGGAHQPRLWSPAAVWIRPAVVAQQAMVPSITSRRFIRLDSADRTATCQRVLMALSPGRPHSSICHRSRLTSSGAVQLSTQPQPQVTESAVCPAQIACLASVARCSCVSLETNVDLFSERARPIAPLRTWRGRHL